MRLVDNLQRGTGLYTLQEAAAFARIPVTTLVAWTFGTSGHRPLRDSDVASKIDGRRYLTFVQLAEAIAIRSHRPYVPFHKIREALVTARKHYGIEHPFTDRSHRTYHIGRELHIILKGEENLIQITGKMIGQQDMVACLQPYLKDFEWDSGDRLKAWVAYRYPSEKKVVDIRLNPTICSGAPMVDGTGHTAETLWREASAVGDMNAAAENFRVPLEAVEAACKYCIEEIRLAAA